MNNTVVIIPTRLRATRFPNKPLKLINKKEMIVHVYELAVRAGVGSVLVTTPDKEIGEIIKQKGGNYFLSSSEHETGTDRVFEAFEKFFSRKPKYIINLQGDMPNLDPREILFLSDYLNKGLSDLVTLAAPLKTNEVEDQNVVKVFTKKEMKKSTFSAASDFHRNITTGHNDSAYHHIGIYGFTNKALIKYVNLKRSKLELERDLEQMRALENNMKIHVGLVNSIPLSVDTEEDLQKIKKNMEK